MTLPFIAKRAGLPVRRAERAMHDLLRAGLVTAQQRAERIEEGGYRGLASLRQLSAALFGAFNLAKWLRHERSKVVMRRYRAAAQIAKAEREQLRTSRAEAQATVALSAMVQSLHNCRPAGAAHTVDASARCRVFAIRAVRRRFSLALVQSVSTSPCPATA